MKLGERLKELRKHKGLTQKELGEFINIPFRTIMNWERCIREPSSANMVILEKFFNVSGEYLRGETELMQWDNKEIMEAVNDELGTCANRLVKVARDVSPKSQKLTSDVMIELRHILNIEKKYEIEEFSSFMQYVLTASTGFIDSCMNAICEDDEVTRIDSAINNAILLYTSALDEVKSKLIDEEKDPQKK